MESMISEQICTSVLDGESLGRMSFRWFSRYQLAGALAGHRLLGSGGWVEGAVCVSSSGSGSGGPCGGEVVVPGATVASLADGDSHVPFPISADCGLSQRSAMHLVSKVVGAVMPRDLGIGVPGRQRPRRVARRCPSAAAVLP